jgi:hypothetical protein
LDDDDDHDREMGNTKKERSMANTSVRCGNGLDNITSVPTFTLSVQVGCVDPMLGRKSVPLT